LHIPYNKGVSRIYSSNEQNFVEICLPLHYTSAIGTYAEEPDTINMKCGLCVPIFSKIDKNRDGTSSAISTLQVTNKKNRGYFTDLNVKILKILSSYITTLIHIT